jgi:hypothetical protein
MQVLTFSAFRSTCRKAQQGANFPLVEQLRADFVSNRKLNVRSVLLDELKGGRELVSHGIHQKALRKNASTNNV